jgi:hypothetical protein
MLVRGIYMKLGNREKFILLELVNERIIQLQNLMVFDKKYGQYLSFLPTLEEHIQTLQNIKKVLNE